MEACLKLTGRKIFCGGVMPRGSPGRELGFAARRKFTGEKAGRPSGERAGLPGREREAWREKKDGLPGEK